MTVLLAHVLESLGYTSSRGYVVSSKFNSLPTNRHSLLQAQSQMGVVGVFGLWTQGIGSQRQFTPLVYVVDGENRSKNDLMTIHRRVWNQGLVPYLILVSDSEIYLCNGFSFSSRQENNNPWSGIIEINSSYFVSSLKPEWINRLSSTALQSSIHWRDHTLDVDMSGRIDHSLLYKLSGLTKALTTQEGILEQNNLKPLGLKEAHGLIGRVLYSYFLYDRNLLPSDWLKKKFSDLDFKNMEPWNSVSFWGLTDDIDQIFNGSIFPLNTTQRKRIKSGHIGIVQLGLRHAEIIDNYGSQGMLPFWDYDYSTIRIETLSSIYEQFLQNYGIQRELGAFYTPPFLVDYVIQCVSAVQPLKVGHKVLDAATGSGTFLVSAYRNIIESQLVGGGSTLPLSELQKILKNSIFGIEWKDEACQIACFNLYLTLLDYVSEAELENLIGKATKKKVFPELLGKNLISCNFFATNQVVNGFPSRFDYIIGNPPWRGLDTKKQEDKLALAYHEKYQADMPIGERQYAELFAWKLLKFHLKKGGVGGLLLPSKSFVNPSSRQFRKQFSAESRFVGVTDLSNLRHVIFEKAQHPATALFFVGEPPKHNDSVWYYFPMRAFQPSLEGQQGRKSKMWTFFMDNALIKDIKYSAIQKDPDIWLKLAWRKAVDDKILDYLDGIGRTQLTTLKKLKELNIIHYARGGNEKETGIPDSYHLVGKEGDNRNYLNHISADIVTPLLKNKKIYPLPKKYLSNANKNYQARFSGPTVLIPRKYQEIYYLDKPAAYNSSFIGLNLGLKGSASLLKCLYYLLDSKVCRYYVLMNSTRYFIDRANVEPKAFDNLPLPTIQKPDEVLNNLEAAAEQGDVEDVIYEMYGLTDETRRVIAEFFEFRIKLSDGNVPAQAIRKVGVKETTQYTNTLSLEIDRWFGRKQSHDIRVITFEEKGIAVVIASYRSSDNEASSISFEKIDVWVDQLINSEYSPLGNTCYKERDRDTLQIRLVKPLEYIHWTMERVVADGEKIINSILDKAHIKEA